MALVFNSPGVSLIASKLKGGMMAVSSFPSTRNGAGCAFVTSPSLIPRVGSFRVRTQIAMMRPGMPTIMNAACQPLSPKGAVSGV